MRARILALIFILLGSSSLHAAVPIHQWSQRFGNTGIDEGRSVAVDASGNVLVTGIFTGTVNFGGGNLVTTGTGVDIFVAKYDADGLHQWSKRFGISNADDEGFSVACDASGNVLVTGFFQGTVDFGGGNLVSAGTHDVFVVKYDAGGVHQWSKRFGGTGFDRGSSLAVDTSGNVLVTGWYQGTVNFGGGNLVSAGSNEIYVAKYDANGVHQWSQRFGAAGDDQGLSVAVDASGNVLVTGHFSDTVDFGGGNLVSAGGNDIYVAKYDAGGVHQWSRRFGSTGTDRGQAVALDASGNGLVTGFFQFTVDFGGGNLVSAGGNDIFVAKYDAGGAHQWSQRFGSAISQDQGNSVAVDASGNVLVTGYFTGTVNFGGSNLVSAGVTDIFIAQYDAGGVHQWSLRFGSTGADRGNSVALEWDPLESTCRHASLSIL